MTSPQKIEAALNLIKSELAIIENEVPGISRGFWYEMHDKAPYEKCERLTADINAARLRKIALQKLTPQDREALGV